MSRLNRRDTIKTLAWDATAAGAAAAHAAEQNIDPRELDVARIQPLLFESEKGAMIN